MLVLFWQLGSEVKFRRKLTAMIKDEPNRTNRRHQPSLYKRPFFSQCIHQPNNNHHHQTNKQQTACQESTNSLFQQLKRTTTTMPASMIALSGLKPVVPLFMAVGTAVTGGVWLGVHNMRTHNEVVYVPHHH